MPQITWTNCADKMPPYSRRYIILKLESCNKLFLKIMVSDELKEMDTIHRRKMEGTKQMNQQCGKWPEGKWHWMMEYCKRNLLHPGEDSNWKQAEKAYEERKE